MGSMYKTYRHCKKHAFRRWQQRRRASKYEAEESKKLVQKEELSPKPGQNPGDEIELEQVQNNQMKKEKKSKKPKAKEFME